MNITLDDAIRIITTILAVVGPVGLIYRWQVDRRKTYHEAGKLDAEEDKIRTEAANSMVTMQAAQLNLTEDLSRRYLEQLNTSVQNKTDILSLDLRVKALESQLTSAEAQNKKLLEDIRKAEEIAEIQQILRRQFEEQIVHERELRIKAELELNKMRVRASDLEAILERSNDTLSSPTRPSLSAAMSMPKSIKDEREKVASSD